MELHWKISWKLLGKLKLEIMKVTKEQLNLIEKIAEKVISKNPGFDKLDIEMDLTYCIEGGCSLRLEDMLKADDFNLLHDICGINGHLDHFTYKLTNGFWPRFAGK